MNKEITKLNYATDQKNLACIYKNIIFSAAHGYK